MYENKNDAKLRSPVMEGAEKPAQIDFSDNINNAFVGVIDMWNIIKSQHHADNKLQNKKKKRDAAGIIQKVVAMPGHKFTFGQLLQLINIVAFLKPVFKL